MASPSSSQPDGRMAAPSLPRPPPRTASNRAPLAWLTTSATRGPSASMAHRLVAYQGIPRDSIGGAVDRIDHHDHLSVRLVRTGLLRHHTEPGPVEHGQRRRIGGQVRPVLPMTGAGESPVIQLAERAGHRRCRVVQYFEQRLVVHGFDDTGGVRDR